MLLEIFTRSGERVCHTEYETCGYDLETLRMMSKAGYVLKLDGKRASFGLTSLKVSTRPASNQPKESQSVINPDIALPMPAEPSSDTAARTSSKRAIRCVETGQTWPTQSAAAKELNIDPAYISEAIRLKKPYKNMTFEKLINE